MTHQQNQGRKGEEIACSFLRKKGYRILERNWRMSYAEIDLIAAWQGQLIFVEVKTRAYDYFGPPEDFVDQKKVDLMADAAHRYIEIHQFEGELRFDIIAILAPSGGDPQINHIEDAFFPGLS